MDAADVVEGVLGLLSASGLTEEEYRNDVPAGATLRHAAKSPRGEIRRYPAGHFDIYIGEQFERVITDQLAF